MEFAALREAENGPNATRAMSALWSLSGAKQTSNAHHEMLAVWRFISPRALRDFHSKERHVIAPKQPACGCE
jgi:hypothetical protein